MRHCTCRPATLLFANLAIVYLVASVAYLVRTRSLGTPFADSLTDEQRAIKATAARRRGAVFRSSFVGAAVIVAVASPFRPTGR